MNWVDYVVGGIVLVSGIIGLINGFIQSAFKLVSFFAAAFISVTFYPTVADFLIKYSGIYQSIKSSIMKNLLLQSQNQAAGAGEKVGQTAADAFMKGLSLPKGIKDMIISKSNIDVGSLLNVNSLADALSSSLARFAINIISVILLFIAIRILLSFVKLILEGVAKLPVFNQVNKLGGFAFGAVEGLLMIYVVLAVISLFSATNKFGELFTAIDSSVFTRFLYQHNFLLDLIAGSGSRSL